MTKGEQLNELLKSADELHGRMRKIFLRNGLNEPDLMVVSKEDREEWYQLYEQSNKLNEQITKLINN